MAMFYEMQRLLDAPLEDVLLKLYSAATLKWFWDVNLRALAETYPGALPQPEPPKRLAVEKGPKKPYLISLLLAVLRDPAMGRRFFDTLPQAAREVLAAVTWERRANLAALEETLGRPIASLNPDPRGVFSEPFLLPPEHGLIMILKDGRDYWGYYSGAEKPKKKDYCVLVPHSIRKAFKRFAPPPAGYELLPLETLPATAQARYSCAQEVGADLRLVAEYIARGHLRYTKSERVAMPSLKALHQMTGRREFFANSDRPDLALLRTRLLAGGMAFTGEKEREKLLTRADSAEPVRELLEKVLANPAFLHEELLGHFPLSRNGWCQYSPASVKDLAVFFGKLSSEKWTSWENIRRYHLLREEIPGIFTRTSGFQASVTSTEASWSTSVLVDEGNEFALVSEPLLKGYAFLLAAFGLAEIAYTMPTHPTYGRPKQAFLSPYDGLGLVRLTPLGEFVFRRRDTCELAGGLPAQSPIILDDARLLATCRNADSLTELALGQFFEKLAPGRYRMTPKSLLGGCHSRSDVEERIRLFRRVVSATPPAIWEELFAKTLARIAPLSLELDYLVLKVSADEDIRRLLASDPALREIVLKVEGLRIAVRRDDLKKLAKRLEQFGYLSPVPRLP